MHFLEECHGKLPNDQLCISLETAHPAKFPDEVAKNTGVDPPLPDSLKGIDNQKEFVTDLADGYDNFRDYLLSLDDI
jgi:threonine synthase